MVHPCIPDYDEGGVELHACHSPSSKKTLCKKKNISAGDVDKTDGAEQLCRDCYPGGKTDVTPDHLVDISPGVG
jgi:hypothetical protein